MKSKPDLIRCPYCDHYNDQWAVGLRNEVRVKRRCQRCKQYATVWCYRVYCTQVIIKDEDIGK